MRAGPIIGTDDTTVTLVTPDDLPPLDPLLVYLDDDVLDQLLAGQSDYHALRPDVWKESHPEAVRVYRAEERAARADAKVTKRARRRAGRK